MNRKKKQKGGILSGPSHKYGGIAAIVGGKEPVELEGGEYIIKKSSVDKLGKKTLDELNKKGRIPTMAQGGKPQSYMKQAWEEMKRKKKQPLTKKEQLASIAAAGKATKRSIGKKPSPANLKKEIAKATKGQEKTIETKAPKAKDYKGETKAPETKPGYYKGETKALKRKKAVGTSKKDFIKSQKAMTSEFGEKGGKKKAVETKPKAVTRYKSKAEWGKLGKHGSAERIAEYKKRGWAMDETTSGPDPKTKPKTPTKFGKEVSKKEAMKRRAKKAKKLKRSKLKAKWIPWSKEAKALRAKKKQKEIDMGAETSIKKWLKRDKKQYGGQINRPMGANQVNPENPMTPTTSIPARPPFRQGVRMMGHGGQVSVSNDKAGAGDVHTTHSHSGYKAGE